MSKQRMGGYRPLQVASTEAGSQVDAPVEEKAKPASNTPASEGTMSSAPAASSSTPDNAGSNSVDTPASSDTEVLPPSQPQRMGSAVPQRMGSAAPQRMGRQDGVSPEVDNTAAAPNRMASTSASSVTVTEQPTERMTQSQPVQTAPSSEKPAPEKRELPKWAKPAIAVGILVLIAAAVVLSARWLRTTEPVQNFLMTYDGHASQPDSAPTGFPAWLGWQHFFNMFLLLLIIKTGLQIRYEKRPSAQWQPKENSFFSPRGNIPKKISIHTWLHQTLDVLWILNGIVFITLLFATGRWMRVVPTSWDIFPNMLSGALQYASLDWPVENSWVHYNALQVMAYFLIIFVAAPLAVLSGLRMSTMWPAALNKFYPIEIARHLHFPVMLFFVFFTVTHVFLVFFTGALQNLNHMYTSKETADAWGLGIFLVSVAVMALAWFGTKPMFTVPIAEKMGSISK